MRDRYLNDQRISERNLEMEMTLLAQRHLMLRHVIGLAPLIALVAAGGPRRGRVRSGHLAGTGHQHHCHLHGRDDGQNGTNGYGVPEDQGNTIIVSPARR